MDIKRRVLWLLLAPFLLVLPSACKTLEAVTDLGTAVAVNSGHLTPEQAASISRSSAAVGKAFTDLTPEQEYYIGRAVGATILARYPAYAGESATRYLNVLGQTLARASDLPETFGGYHFLILDTEEITAFAAPGGLIFVSRGLLRCCRSEDALAAVLAHEIGHVQHRHGLQAIRKSRLTTALTILGTEGAKQLGGKELAEVTAAFEDSIHDTAGTLINSGYSRAFEREADLAAVRIMQRVGYDPRALVELLAEMKKRLRPGGAGFARTHPDPLERIEAIRAVAEGTPRRADVGARQQRFGTALLGV